MILWVALLMSRWCSSLTGAAAEGTTLKRIERCATRCSQGLHCKPKANELLDLFPRPCQDSVDALDASSVFRNVSLSTVMSCPGRQKCSLHLRIKATLQLSESVHGVSFCTASPGMMMDCQMFSFSKASRERMSGQQVEVENDCADISPNQQVQVLVKTVPNYCDTTWTGTFDAPVCVSEDLRRHVPECITGRLSYEVDAERKEMKVSVSDMLEDHNYYLRLCRKDFTCGSTEAIALIKKEEPVKSAVFLYARPLPCLCIEGWSAVMDARRVQVCPFKGRVEELWFGFTFDPLEQALSWEPACPVAAVVALCQATEDGACAELPHTSRNVSRQKIIFTKVDPHPRLCMKFTAGSQSWTRCPFADLRVQAWEVVVRGHEEVEMLAHATATFSVGLCGKPSQAGSCQVTETHTLHVEKNKAVALNLTWELCSSCLWVKRLDVNYAIPAVHCLHRCNVVFSTPIAAVHPFKAADQSLALRPQNTNRSSIDFTWVIVPAGVCLAGVLMVTLVLHVLLTVYQRRKQKRHKDKKQMAPAVDCMVSTLQAPTILHGGILIPDSPQCGNAEKVVLISN